jgi:hypothetical protein
MLEMVNVPPLNSSGVALPARAFSASDLALGKFQQRQPFGGADDGHDETLFQRDGDAEVDVAVPARGLAVGRAVDRREFLQRQHHGLGDKIRDGIGRARRLELAAVGDQDRSCPRRR